MPVDVQRHGRIPLRDHQVTSDCPIPVIVRDGYLSYDLNTQDWELAQKFDQWLEEMQYRARAGWKDSMSGYYGPSRIAILAAQLNDALEELEIAQAKVKRIQDAIKKEHR